jgi:uncharacterized membrane protein YtjA (UPF0391 family)
MRAFGSRTIQPRHSPNALDALRTDRSITMLHYAVVFFVIAIIAAILGFGNIAAGAAGIAKILFYVFLVLAVLSILSGMFRKK